VTKHLRVLERAGLIHKGRDAQRRPCRIEAQPLKEATDWIAQYRQFWEQRLDRLDAYLQEIQS
jgi:DNA-binding transcriptional ArsR family regulator